MTSTTVRIGAAAVVTSMVAVIAHGQVSFHGIGDISGGAFESEATRVSGDGRVAVGWGTPAVGRREAVSWTADSGLHVIGDFAGGEVFGDAFDASFDGRVVVGRGENADGNRAYRWTSGSGMVSLGTLPDHVFSLAWGVSGDGSIVTGFSRSNDHQEAFRWTADEGMVGIGQLMDEGRRSVAFGISTDGTTIVGRADGPNGNEAFRWTEADGMVGLGDLPGDSFDSHANDVSFDGSVIVGHSRSASLGDDEAFRWTAMLGMQGLGALPGFSSSYARGVSGDGATIVGYCFGGGGYGAFIWEADRGMRDLQTVLTDDYGLDLTGWQLSRALSVSDDGQTIVGFGINPDGNQEGWVVTVPGPSGLVALVGGLAGVTGRRRTG